MFFSVSTKETSTKYLKQKWYWNIFQNPMLLQHLVTFVEFKDIDFLTYIKAIPVSENMYLFLFLFFLQ